MNLLSQMQMYWLIFVEMFNELFTMRGVEDFPTDSNKVVDKSQ